MLTHLGVSARARDTQEEQWWYEPIVCRPFVLRYPSRGYPGEGNSERSSLETASETTCTGLPEKIHSFFPAIPVSSRVFTNGVLRIRRESAILKQKRILISNAISEELRYWLFLLEIRVSARVSTDKSLGIREEYSETKTNTYWLIARVFGRVFLFVFIYIIQEKN